MARRHPNFHPSRAARRAPGVGSIGGLERPDGGDGVGPCPSFVVARRLVQGGQVGLNVVGFGGAEVDVAG